MTCRLCSEKNVGPDHEISERHIKNKVLYDYSANRKQFTGNRQGVIVSCNVKSSFATLIGSIDAKVKISAKPNEEVSFQFNIENESKKEDLLIVFIQKGHDKLQFVMNNHGMELGSRPYILAPKNKVEREVSIKFKSPYVGQYEIPVIFSFRKNFTNEAIIVIRDVVVFVEETQVTHTKVISPYTKKEVMAQHLYKTVSKQHNRSGEKFRIPKNYKTIYAGALKVSKEASQEEKDLLADITDVFTTGVTKENYVRFFHNLLWYEETIIRINLKNFNMSGVPLVLHGDAFALVVPGLAEKRPSLMLGDILFVRPQDNEEVMFEAFISDIQENVAHFRGVNPEFNKYYNATARFDIRFFLSRVPLERMHCAIHSIREQSQECRAFPEENQSINKVPQITKFYNPLVEQNAEQRKAVEHILAGTSGTAPYLLHGPPGTGKTVTIVEAILQLANKNPHNRILVCTDSNMAADNVAVMLIKYLHNFNTDKFLLRANSKYRVWSTLPECLEPYSNGTNRDNFVSISIAEFKKYRIVITTLSHSAKYASDVKSKKHSRHITHLFIDEAAQASEPSAMIPTCGLLAARGALVLAGDPLQLGPVVISNNARKIGLGLSLMERLQLTNELYSDKRNDPNYVVMLRNNFRSNPDILDIPNEIFYKGLLVPQAALDPLSTVDILGERRESRAIVFHGVLSKEQRMGKSPSFFNSMELEIVQLYVKFLVTEHHVDLDDIGVVTPYIRQVYQIKRWLQSINYSKVEVGTVEAFQGKEKRVIIISTVRANCDLLSHDAKFQLGFLVDDKRFNVALTRAKAKAIIIGNPLCLQKDEKWRKYMQKCRELGTYFGFEGDLIHNDKTQKEIVDAITPIVKQLKINKKSRA